MVPRGEPHADAATHVAASTGMRGRCCALNLSRPGARTCGLSECCFALFCGVLALGTRVFVSFLLRKFWPAAPETRFFVSSNEAIMIPLPNNKSTPAPLASFTFCVSYAHYSHVIRREEATKLSITIHRRCTKSHCVFHSCR